MDVDRKLRSDGGCGQRMMEGVVGVSNRREYHWISCASATGRPAAAEVVVGASGSAKLTVGCVMHAVILQIRLMSAERAMLLMQVKVSRRARGVAGDEYFHDRFCSSVVGNDRSHGGSSFFGEGEKVEVYGVEFFHYSFLLHCSFLLLQNIFLVEDYV